MNRRTDIQFLDLLLPQMFGAIWEKESFSISTCSDRQLDMLLGDVAEWGRGLSKVRVDELDRCLEAADLPLLTTMMKGSARNARQIVARGHIKSDDEFRLLNGIVSDVESSVFSAEEKVSVESMLGMYESSHNGNAL